eukprot:jgi/Botrbrau1/4249/Bobra.0044s0044.1
MSAVFVAQVPGAGPSLKNLVRAIVRLARGLPSLVCEMLASASNLRRLSICPCKLCQRKKRLLAPVPLTFLDKARKREEDIHLLS